MGEVSEVSVNINGVKTKALCDTGSCVSTCSEKFFNECLFGVELKPLKNILKVECADGNTLPYSGYVEVNLLPIGVQSAKEQPCLFLVVPNTDFNLKTPVLLGTNVLESIMLSCKDDFGDRFL